MDAAFQTLIAPLTLLPLVMSMVQTTTAPLLQAFVSQALLLDHHAHLDTPVMEGHAPMMPAAVLMAIALKISPITVAPVEQITVAMASLVLPPLWPKLSVHKVKLVLLVALVKRKSVWLKLLHQLW
jgi:hypothetical protein